MRALEQVAGKLFADHTQAYTIARETGQRSLKILALSIKLEKLVLLGHYHLGKVHWMSLFG